MPSVSTRSEGFVPARVRAPRGFRPVLRGTALLGWGAILLTGGCGEQDAARAPVFPVQGQVRFEGRPAPGAFVVFHPVEDQGEEAPRPNATVKPDGSFNLTTYDLDDGAPPGDYTVTVEWRKLVTKGTEAEAGPNVLPDRYGTPKTTPLKVTVAEAPNDLPALEITTK